MAEILWQPTPAGISAANMTQFREYINEQYNVNHADYDALYEWSLAQPEKFWLSTWEWCDVSASARGDTVLVDADKMPGASWFPDARLNFAENLLRKKGSEPALIFRSENNAKRSLSWDGLHQQVARVANYLRRIDIRPGDRVAAFMPNVPETVVAMLAAASVGAVWSSSSPDFGVQGVVDRFGQIEPRVLFTSDGYFYNGKFHDSLGKVSEFLQQLKSVEQVVVVPFENPAADFQCQVPGAVSYATICEGHSDEMPAFEQLPFAHPLYVMYSSGTTGVPKCIVHSAGGSLLKHLVEHRLHCNVNDGDRLFYFTTCGWMMWNWLVTGLASGATLLLYDGSPFYPDANVIFDFAEQEQMNQLGTSAKYIDALSKEGLKPIDTHDLSSVRSIFSTGSPLSPEGFSYVYESVKSDVCLSSVSGGTDILACFVGGNPVLPVYRGEIQCRLLGMAIEVFNDEGKAVQGEKGELVCTKVFPSMPIGFWNDDDGSKYHNAYFDRYENIWCHGDFVELTDTGGMVIYGRSDAVLNPGGVRIGTAEIYRQVEQLEEIVESLVVGQQWESDTRVVLFVRLSEGVTLDDSLRQKIKDKVRANCTPRHVPARIAAVADIPRTKSGKIVELAVRNVVHGESVKNKEALANPEALAYFENVPELQS